MKWQLETDFRVVIRGAFGPHRLPRPRGWDLVIFVAGKTVFLSLAFVLPMVFHPVWVVLGYYAAVALVMGMLMSTVFEIPHVVAGASFPMPRPDTGRMEAPWAVHQAQATLDFGRNDRAATWYLGGLNFHREHHLLPLVCHVNYPALAGLVDQVCRECGVQCAQHRSFWSGLAAHYRWLRQMGRPGAGEAA
jgi:linoleoyl-CoA desaturase